MALVNLGRDIIASALLGDAAYALFNNANAALGVGDSATAYAATQTDLQAVTNKLRKAMDSTYPQRTANVLTLRSTFATAEANWAWAEWGTFNNVTGAQMLQRIVSALGTKTSAASWQLTATLTFVLV